MGKASRTKQQPDRRARIAAQREAERRREQRRRIYLAGGSVLVVAIIAVAFVIFKGGSGSGSGASSGPTGTALAAVVKKTTSVPAATLDKFGSGSGVTPPFKLTPAQPALTSGGKPEMLYVGAEYCPYCAAERWSMVVALNRFGTFTGLATVHSSSTDVDANTPTWTFAHSTYSSPYLTFNSVEEYTNVATSGGYTTLQTPTAAEQAIFAKYDSTPFLSSAQNDGSYPFIDFGNKYEVSGASYNPQVLSGKTWAQIAAALSDSSSPIAQAVNGTANYLTAAICSMTGNKPATACTPAVQTLETALAN
jgi:hypothetical protein